MNYELKPGKETSSNFNYRLLRVNNIAGGLYTPREAKKANILVIYGIGAPISPDNGNLPDAPVITNHGLDIFVPDYIGYGRSDGVFTPQNCINTFLQLYDNFRSGTLGSSSYDSLNIEMQYNRIIFIGRSLGGTYVPLLPRFNSKISELAIFCPVVDSKSCGSIPGEETNEQFLRSMREDGYHHLYRGVLEPVWIDHLENRDDLSPMDNIAFLQNAKLFIGHGTKDPVVHYSKSIKYLEQIQQTFPTKMQSFKLNLYENGGHGQTTTNPAAEDFLTWLGL